MAKTKDIISAGTAAMLAVTLVATGVSTAASPLADPRTRRQPVDHRLYHASLSSRELAHNRSSKPASHRFDLFEPEWASSLPAPRRIVTDWEVVRKWFDGADRCGLRTFHKEPNGWGCELNGCMRYSLASADLINRVIRGGSGEK